MMRLDLPSAFAGMGLAFFIAHGFRGDGPQEAFAAAAILCFGIGIAMRILGRRVHRSGYTS
jgi:hypothetical protein